MEQILGRNLVKRLFEKKFSVKKHNNNVNEYLACNTEITVEMRERELINSKPNIV